LLSLAIRKVAIHGGDESEELVYSRTGALVPDASGGGQPTSSGLTQRAVFLRHRPAKNLAGLLRRVLFAVYGYPNDDGSLQNHGFKLRSWQFPSLKSNPSSALPIIQHRSIVSTILALTIGQFLPLSRNARKCYDASKGLEITTRNYLA
jgi:hypothetical protein